MPRPQFTFRALLVAMLVVACWFGGIWFERERRRRFSRALKPLEYRGPIWKEHFLAIPVLLITSDLACSSNVAGAAKHAGVELRTALGLAAIEGKLGPVCPSLAILDLSTAGLNPRELVPQLRPRLADGARIIAFGPHVHAAALAAAREAGCDLVVSRGEFHARVDDYLRNFAKPSRPTT
jgi:CheY-like chemotaxis protein